MAEKRIALKVRGFIFRSTRPIVSLAASIIICLFAACSTNQVKSQTERLQDSKTLMEMAQASLTTLTHEAAAQRSDQVSNVSYTLWFGLEENQESFEGTTEIQFDWKSKGNSEEGVFLDFEGGQIHFLSVNGVPLTDFNSPKRFDGHHIYIKKTELARTNRVLVRYNHPYSTDGNGLYRFKDPVDGRVYLYSNFEPYNAHRVFPCFDQPDLKASYEVTADAPKGWEVISNTREQTVSNVDGRKSWQFPRSSAFSTYVFALHAGPYAKWESSADEIPIRLFSRKSLAQYVDHREWLDITKKGLAFFSIQFGYPYPFQKYDQLIVPDFNTGAMENVGAVTFNEKTIYRTHVTEDTKRGRADVILHEMAHMWFGNLVTMKWWNGLWLNESFATFMAAWATREATSYQGSWESFLARVKQPAYQEDQLSTTHPIELPVHDTAHAEAIFDGITYGKGASSLKQLDFLIGPDQFKDGLQRYFQKYAYKNTTLADFIHMLSEASGQDLNQWQTSWLQTSGLNSVRVDWQCYPNPKKATQSIISSMKILQYPSHQGDLRPHKTLIGLYSFVKTSKKDTALRAVETIEAAYSGAETQIPGAVGMECPSMVFPNEQDHDYVKIDLDPVSMEIASSHLNKISEPLTRQAIWNMLWEKVVDGKMLSQEYAELALKHIGHEKNTRVLTQVLPNLVRLEGNQPSVLKYMEPTLRKSYQSRIEAFVEKNWFESPPNTDLRLVWYKAFIRIASSPTAIKMASKLLDQKGRSQIMRGIPLDHEHRWDLIQVLARSGEKDITQRITEMLHQDQTHTGEKQAISAQALIPNAESKKSWLDKILKEKRTLSPSKLRQAMSNYHVLGHEEFTRASVEPFFSTLPKLALSGVPENEDFATWLAESMYPSLCEPEIIQKTEGVLLTYPHLPATVVRHLKVGMQEEKRCIQARILSERAGRS